MPIPNFAVISQTHRYPDGSILGTVLSRHTYFDAAVKQHGVLQRRILAAQGEAGKAEADLLEVIAVENVDGPEAFGKVVTGVGFTRAMEISLPMRQARARSRTVVARKEHKQ